MHCACRACPNGQGGCEVEVLYFLVPLSVVLVYLILIGIWWAIHHGQFDEIDLEADRVLRDP